MKNLPVHGDHDGLGRVDDAIDVVLTDFAVVAALARYRDDSARVESVYVGSAYADHAAGHLYTRHHLGRLDGLRDGAHGVFYIDHDPFPEAV